MNLSRAANLSICMEGEESGKKHKKKFECRLKSQLHFEVQ